MHRWVAELGCLRHVVVDEGVQFAVAGQALLDEIAGRSAVGGLVVDVDDAVDSLADQVAQLAGVGGVGGELDPLAPGGRGLLGGTAWARITSWPSTSRLAASSGRWSNCLGSTGKR